MNGKPQAVEVSFTEEQLASKAAEAAQTATQGIAAQDKIHLSGSQVIATSAQIGNAMHPSRLGLLTDVSHLTVVNGKLVIRATEKP